MDCPPSILVGLARVTGVLQTQLSRRHADGALGRHLKRHAQISAGESISAVPERLACQRSQRTNIEGNTSTAASMASKMV